MDPYHLEGIRLVIVAPGRTSAISAPHSLLAGGAAVVCGLLTGLAWPFGALLVTAISLVVVGILAPTALLTLLVLSIPVQDSVSINASVGEVTATRLIVGALVLSYGVNVVRGRARPRLGLVGWGHALVIGSLMASVVAVIDPGVWASEVYRWVAAAVVFIIADDILQRSNARSAVIVVVGLGVIATSLVGFLQVITTDGPPSYVVGGVLRAYATFGAPNTFAAYLELALPLLAALTVAGWKSGVEQSWLRWWCVVAASLGGIALLLTQSRGGLLGIGAALAVVAFAGSRNVRRTTVVLCVGVAAMLLLPVGDRMARPIADLAVPSRSLVDVTPANWANQERSAHWSAGVRMMRQYPISGVGAGHYNLRYREHTPVWRFRIPRGHAHNGYIQMGAQAGYPGLAAMVVFTGILLMTTACGVAHARSRQERSVALGALGIVVAFSVHSIVDYLNVLSLGLQLAVMVALVTAMSRQGKNQPPSRTAVVAR